MPYFEAGYQIMKGFSYPIWIHICQSSGFPSLYPWMQTGSGGTTLLSLDLCGQRGKALLWEDRGRVWRSLFVDLQIDFLVP